MAKVIDKREREKIVLKNFKRDCMPCKEFGSVVEAKKYCRDCRKYMCAMCGLVHRKSASSRNHRVSSGLLAKLPTQGPGEKLPLTYCENHKDREIEWYCEEHDELVCLSCKTIKHRSCKLNSVLEMPEMPRFSKKLSEILRALASVRSRVLNLERVRKQNVAELMYLKNSAEEEVRKFKTKINDLVEKLEQKLLAEIKNVVTEETNSMSHHLRVCTALIPEVDMDTKVVMEAKEAEDNSVNVIAAHKLSKTLNELENTVADMEGESYKVKIEFQPDRTLVNMLNSVVSLGTMKIDYPASATFGANPGEVTKALSERKIESATVLDIPSAGITGSTFMPDEQLVLADNTKSKIILLDRNLKIKSKLKLPIQPFEVAANSAKDVLVSLPFSKTLQYVNIYPCLRAGKSIRTNKSCWGVMVHNADIYVSLHNSPGDGEVQVLDRRGGIKRRFGVDQAGQGVFMSPYYITVSGRGTVYVSDSKGRIVSYNDSGDMVYDVKATSMKWPRGMIVDKDETLIVCCEDSNAVNMLRKNGSRHRMLLSTEDGVHLPKSVSFRNTDDTLVVTMYNSRSCAYRIK